MSSIVSDVAKHYDDLDGYYRQLWGDHLHHGLWQTPTDSIETAVIQLIDQLAQHLNITPSGRLCDVGCGYGSTLRYLAKSRGWAGVGFTVSLRQADYAKSQNQNFPDIEVHCQDWMESKLETSSVDAVIAIESTEHMPSFETFLHQSKRVMKPGGRIAIAAWLRDPASPKILDRWLNDFIVSEGRLARMMYTDDFTQSVAKEFRIVSVKDVSRQVRRTWWHCAKRVVLQFFRSAEFRKRCFDMKFENRIFAVTVFRILLSYYLGSMRYYVLVAEKS